MTLERPRETGKNGSGSYCVAVIKGENTVHPSFDFKIENKVFLVTGGAAGIGAGLVRTLLSENARCVAFVDIAEREGAGLESELLLKFGALRAKFIKCDISDEAQLAAAYRQLLDKYRRLDVVINNAAVLSADDRLCKKMVEINFTATVSSTLKALDIMTVQHGGSGGTVVNVSSLLALTQHSHLPVYAATKTAVLQFSNSIGAKENYLKTRVHVLTVCLGPTDTAILQRQNFGQDSAQNLISRAPERQRIESAANGILEVIKQGQSGSTWLIANDKAPIDISKHVKEGFEILSCDALLNDTI